MKKKITYFVSQPSLIYIIYLITSLLAAITKYLRGNCAYNNYLIFKGVFFNTLAKTNLYDRYPGAYQDVNHYGILFSVLIAPFAFLPDWLGMTLWNMANTSIFLYAVHLLPFDNKKKSFFCWLCLIEFNTAAVSFQFNIALTGILLLSWAWIHTQKEMKSAFAIALGTFVKIYGVVGLSSFFFVKNKKRFIFSLIGFSLLFLLIPMLYSNVYFGWHSYLDWFVELKNKNEGNQVLGNMQDISLMGFFRRILHDASISNLTFLSFGLPLFLLPYLRVKQYQYLPFRLMILASTLLFTVLFSSGSESPTYIIAISGVMIWFLMQKKQSKLSIFLLCFVLVFTCLSSSDLFPCWIKHKYIIKYSIKALPCILVWLRISYELLFRNFQNDYQLES